ncbi:MAG: hypothetical protein QM534_05490 [Sediminibacterium sp.]|nr:hypothetical protein [Sediminibacterium sp.]
MGNKNFGVKKWYYFLPLILFCLLSCSEKKVDSTSQKGTNSFFRKREIEEEVVKFINKYENSSFKVYQIFQSSDNVKTTLILRATKSKYENLSCPIDTFWLYADKLVLIMNSNYLQKSISNIKHYNSRYSEVNNFFDNNRQSIVNDIDDNNHFIENKDIIPNFYSRTMKIDIFYNDSIVAEYPIKDLSSIYIKYATEEKTPFRFNIDSLMEK